MMFFKRPDQLELPIDLICTNPDQPRKVFCDSELSDLCDSIKEYGVIQPIIVKKDGRGKGLYILIAGERRLRAASMAGLKMIPAIIKEADDKDAAFLALIENVQRQDLNFIEEAMAYKQLMDVHGLTQMEIAKKMGKKQSTISNKIRLLALPADILEALTENQLTERHARALLKIRDDKIRRQVLDRIIAHGLNVKQSEKLIEEVLAKQEEEKRKVDKLRFINYRIYINTIKKAFGSIHEVEKDAKYYQEDKGDHLELRILIPKKENKPTMLAGNQ
ncbi:MAG: ParB/RepB/Spo0J family partition protein [Anaerovoracaceae bacterium]